MLMLQMPLGSIWQSELYLYHKLNQICQKHFVYLYLYARIEVKRIFGISVIA